MAAKMNKKRKATLDSILSTVERGFATVANDITDIKSKMATKDDIANLGGQLTSVERELKSIRRDLDDLGERSRMSPASRKKSTTHLSALPQLKSTSVSTRKSQPDRQASTTAQ
jgi:hypothetical protein